MLFPTATFAIFFMLVLPLSWLLQPRGERWRPFIVVASFVFYAAWDWKFCLLLAFSIVWNYASGSESTAAATRTTGSGCSRSRSSGTSGCSAYFKYYDFFVTSTHNLFALVGLDVPLDTRSIVLPVGISFFTFMGIAYVVDVYRRDFAPVGLGPRRLPLLLPAPRRRADCPAGRADPAAVDAARPRYVDTSRAFFLIGTGLFMKVVIANHLAANIVDQVFGAPNRHPSLEVLVGIYAYAVQIFSDFFGYTNIAIGIALLLGFAFPQKLDALLRDLRSRTSGAAGT